MTSAADLFVSANDAFFDDDYDEALKLYTKAIEADPAHSEALLRRCTVYQKLNQFDNALKDANKALEILNGPKGTRSLLARANLQKGIILFHQKQYLEAQKAFKATQELNPNERSLATWLRKVDDMLPPAPPAPTSAPASTPAPPTPVVTEPVAAATPQGVRARHEWFQNDTYVTVEVFIKKVNPDKVNLEFFDRSISLSIKMPTGSEYTLDLDPLAHDILPKESSYKVLSTKIEIKLKKKVEGIKWGTLEGEDVFPVAMAASSVTSARKQKDWNALVRDIEKEQENPEGEAAVNALFQKIYSGADDDTRRAMMKSFVESNGTCLSTNWAEVGAKKVETRPPEGMIAKKYNE
ncbi:SGS domain-containing protein [Dichotomocladium elegans]|nr:SGS domain-containing protein [Dichotomocladium elegans]